MFGNLTLVYGHSSLYSDASERLAEQRGTQDRARWPVIAGGTSIMAIPIRPPSPQRQPKTWSRQGPYPQDPPHRLRPANRPVPPNGTCPCAVRRRYRPRKQLPASCSLVTVQRVLKWQLPGKARPRTARAPRRSRDCQFARPPSVAFPPSDFAGVMRAGTAMLCVDLRAPDVVYQTTSWPARMNLTAGPPVLRLAKSQLTTSLRCSMTSV
jgi:hypothetical protein